MSKPIDKNHPEDKRPEGKTKEHHRVAYRLEGVVKNVGIKPKKKDSKDK